MHKQQIWLRYLIANHGGTEMRRPFQPRREPLTRLFLNYVATGLGCNFSPNRLIAIFYISL